MTSSFSLSMLFIVWTILYFAPGMLMSEMLFASTFPLYKRLFLGVCISISAYIFIGYILSAFSILSSSLSVGIIIFLDLVLLISYIHHINNNGASFISSLKKLDARSCLFITALVIVFALAILVFFTWQNKAPGIGSWDLSDQLPRMLDLDYHNGIPEHELGTLVKPYYPRGFHVAGLFYTAPFFSRISSVGLSSPLLGFVSIIIGLQMAGIFVLSRSLYGGKRAAIFAAAFGIAFSLPAIFTSYPCNLGMVVIIACLILETEIIKSGRISPFNLFLISAFATVIFLIHLVTFLIFIAFTLAFSLGILFSAKRMGHNRRKSLLLIAAIVISVFIIAAFLSVTSPQLLKGTVNYMGIRGEGEAVSSEVTPESFFRNAFQFRYRELTGMLFYMLFMVPFILLGIYRGFSTRNWVLLLLLGAAIYLSLSKLVWFNWRVNFYMFIPLTLLAGLGVVELIERSGSRFKTHLSFCLVIMLIIISMLGITYEFANSGTYMHGVGYWGLKHRLATYVTEEAYETAEWIKDNELEYITFATDDQGAHYLLLSAITDARILTASGFPGIQSFADMKELFDAHTSRDRRLEIMLQYGVEGLITNKIATLEDLMADDLGLVVYSPSIGYWILIPPYIAVSVVAAPQS